MNLLSSCWCVFQTLLYIIQLSKLLEKKTKKKEKREQDSVKKKVSGRQQQCFFRKVRKKGVKS